MTQSWPIIAFLPTASASKILLPFRLSSLVGDNITAASGSTPWYAGPALISHLETGAIDDTGEQRRPFRMPVQWVNRPNLDFRGFAGLISQGSVRPGDAVQVLPSGRTSTVARVVTSEDLQEAVAGQSVTLTLADALDCGRGDVLAAAEDSPIADQFKRRWCGWPTRNCFPAVPTG